MSIRCTPTSCGPVTPACRSSTRSIGSGTVGRSRPAGWWRSSTGRRSSTCRPPSTCPSRGRCTSSRCPSCPTPKPSRPCERLEQWKEALGEWYDRPHPIDQRYIGPIPWSTGQGVNAEPRQQLWMRADGELPDDPLLHACMAAYASDLSLLTRSLRPHGLHWDEGCRQGGQPRPRPCGSTARFGPTTGFSTTRLPDRVRPRAGPGPRLLLRPSRPPGRLGRPGGPGSSSAGPREGDSGGERGE